MWNLLKELAREDKLTPVQKFLTASTMPPEELYDLQTDPHEIHNLVNATNATHQATLKRMRQVLENWIVRSNDQGRFPEVPAARQP